MNIAKAYLSNDKDMIKFQYGDKIIRFRGPYSLEKFTSVKEWDNLYIDAAHFLKPIKEVRLDYGQN